MPAQPDPFAASHMAEGYARHRPPVHERILERAFSASSENPGRTTQARTTHAMSALDIGCGAGVSTRALGPYATAITGLDPVESMVRIAASLLPQAAFVAGSAESLPFASGAFDRMTAAGSLNYVPILDLFWAEAHRVLRPPRKDIGGGGDLLIYDFATGRSLADSPLLDTWFTQEFLVRFPPLQGSSAAPYRTTPALLQLVQSPDFARNTGFQVTAMEEMVEIPVELDRDSYLNYLMTSTNVTGSQPEARSWCDATLERAWSRGGNHPRARKVIFRCSWALLACRPPFSTPRLSYRPIG